MNTPVIIGKTITIDTTKPLPIYDNGPAKAYAAADPGRARGKHLIALICDPAYIARRSTLAAYKGLTSPAAAVLVANEIVFWPPANEERYVIVYEHNFHGPLIAKGKEKPTPTWRDSDILEFFAKPLVNLLIDLSNRGVFHGCIRTSNIFLTMPDRPSHIVLGDGFSVPPSCTQDVLFETPERGLAHPMARGTGTSADDIYSFGVALALLMRSEDPIQGLREEEIVLHKLHHSSFSSLAGRDRFSGPLLELLRGTLQDNPEQRWKVEDLQSWLDGRRLTPQQSYRNKKAVRPIDFMGQKYHFARELAYAMSQNPLQAQSLIESGEILEWLERSVSDMEMVETIKNFLGKDMGKSKTKSNAAALVSGFISTLEPSFPVFFKDKAFFPDGLGYYAVYLSKSNMDLSDVADLIHLGIMINYLFLQTKNSNQSSLLKSYENARSSLGQTNIGFGLERSLYILCRDSQCLSPRLNKYMVMGMEDYLQSLENICKENGLNTAIILDRHTTAYFSVFEGSVIDARLFDLNSKNKHQNILANLKVLSLMQKRTKGGSYPYLAKVLADNLSEILSRFHNKELKQDVEKDLAKSAKSGNISEVFDIIENPNTKRKDRDDFRRAMQEYAALRDEYKMLENGMRNPATFGQSSGHSIAAALSWALALIIVIVMLAFHFSGYKG